MIILENVFCVDRGVTVCLNRACVYQLYKLALFVFYFHDNTTLATEKSVSWLGITNREFTEYGVMVVWSKNSELFVGFTV